MSQEMIVFALMIGIGIVAIIFIVLGILGLSEQERINKSSKFYISVNWLIAGILLIPAVMLYMFHRVNWIKSISENCSDILSGALIIIAMFVSGLYIILNKEKIDNPMLIGFARRGFVFSIMGIIALVYWWIKWHGFN